MIQFSVSKSDLIPLFYYPFYFIKFQSKLSSLKAAFEIDLEYDRLDHILPDSFWTDYNFPLCSKLYCEEDGIMSKIDLREFGHVWKKAKNKEQENDRDYKIELVMLVMIIIITRAVNSVYVNVLYLIIQFCITNDTMYIMFKMVSLS